MIIFNKIMIILGIIVCLAYFGHTANILVLLPLPFYSHTVNFMPVFKALAARGHNVTMYSPFPMKTPVTNLTEVTVPLLLQSTLSNRLNEAMSKDTFFRRLTVLWTMGLNGVERSLKVDKIKQLINDKDAKFDLIMLETWFFQEAFLAFGYRFNAPVINLSPTFLFPSAASFTGNYLPVTYVPNLRYGFTDLMSFSERLTNSFHYAWESFIGYYFYLKYQDALMRKYFIYPGSENLPDLSDLLRNTSLTLVDSHVAVNYPVPLHKNIVYFGGANIVTGDKLPQDLQIIMDSAKEGIIYFSFGSYINISTLQPFMRKAIFSALGCMKQKILMKIEDSKLLNGYQLQNIEARTWFPQSSVLAHENCKLFITHGGLHGLMEAIYHAVPMVGIPLVADQKHNTKFIEKLGIGIVIDKEDLSETKLSNAINTVLKDQSYVERIKERSAIFKDQPIDILDNAVYWIEYVIRYKGAPHLRPAILDQYWYQRLMIDVIAFYLLVIFLIGYIIIKIFRKLYKFIRYICCSKASKNRSKKSKNE
ncbi:hypothetical protein O3M35_009280 [Rhynocoris fuscipes]|uniref:UDP-glucuronosyltransferase n=1 Tax=Rhynocoris fuscipes TaxID=488301 RepID=A0AAW1D9Y7_9HEMI